MILSFDINAFLTTPASELEQLSWYEMISRMGLASFNWSGSKPMDLIARLTEIQSSTKVLMVGCGAGGTSLYLSEFTSAEIWGIDIAAESIRKAEKLAENSSLVNRLHFQIADAHSLPFDAATFDVVITEFMAFFLKPEAFKEFHRVLKPTGTLALAEIMLDDNVTPDAEKKIKEIEQVYSGLTEQLFHIPKISHYMKYCLDAGFQKPELPHKFPSPKVRDMIPLVGGWKNLFKVLKRSLRLMKESVIIKERFLKNKKVKKILIRDRRTAKFILQGVMLAQK